jgi:phage protein D
MPDTQQLQSQFYITINGTEAQSEFMRDLERVTVETSLHLPDMATLVLHDPKLHWVDHPDIEPGVPILIAASAGAGESPIFDGEIVEIEPEYTAGAQLMVIRALDRLHRLARGSHVRSFANVTDGDLVHSMADEARLQAEVGPTNQVYSYVLQANETNLAFLQRRAAALGYLLFVEGETLFCKAPESAKPSIEVIWGETLYEFRPRLTTVGQISEVFARGWDPTTKQPIYGKAADSRIAPQVGNQHRGGRRSGGEVAQQAFDLATELLVADRPIRSQVLADRLAQAAADRMAGHFIEAEGQCAGIPALVAGIPLTISAVGDRFSGSYFVTGATHVASPTDGYQTSFTISGLNPATLLYLLAPETESLAATGLVIGIVTDNEDPNGEGRVKVSFPWLSPDHASDWARVVNVGAGNARGVQFLPEVNDEVLVGFEMGDINYPYVLGGLWNGVDLPPRKSQQAIKGGKVRQRIILSRTGHEITLDDDESTGGITIKDRAGNTITFDSNSKSVTIAAQRDLSIVAQGNITIEAQLGLMLKAQGVELDGQAKTVDVKGSVINLN